MKSCKLFFLFLFCITIPSYSAPPEICRVQGGHTKTVWGTGFFKGATEVYAADIPFDEKAVISALESVDYDRTMYLPAVPPKDNKQLNILTADPRGLIMAVEFSDDYSPEGFYGDRIGNDVLWIKNRDGFSKPWLVKSPKPWFAYPGKIEAGELIRVFGRNMDARLIAIKKPGAGKVRMLKSSTVKARDDINTHNVLYETEVRIPDDMDPGDYELYIHNGSGGKAGWSDPVHFTVKPPEKIPVYYPAANYGVKATGYTDDTDALKNALTAASKTGGTVILPAGSVVISETVELPENVSIRGAGEGATSIRVIKDYPIHGGFPENAKLEYYPNDWTPVLKDYTPMLWLRNNSSISDLSLVYGPGADLGIIIARCPGVSENIHIERINVTANYQADGWHTSFPVLILGNTCGLVIADNDFRGWGAVEVVANNHHQAYIGRNKMVTFPTGIANTFFTRGFNESVIESNEAYYGSRNYSSQSGKRYGKNNNPNPNTSPDVSTVHLAMIGNVYTDNLARRHNAGEMMIESGFAQWWGNIKKATGNTVTVEGNPFDGDFTDNYILIIDGKGIGQYRRVISNTKNQLTTEKNWDIVPDETTCISVGGFNVEHLWIDNTLNNNASWSGFWGNNIGHAVDGQIMRDGAPFYLWGWDPDHPATVAFIDVIGTRTIGGGGFGILGSPVFGNTVRYCEFVDFRYYPNFHINPSWLGKGDPSGIFGISFYFKFKFKNIPETAPLNGWNIFEGNNIADGPYGIHIPSFADYTILKRNAFNVDKDSCINESKTTVIK